jgi:hypothetical protein
VALVLAALTASCSVRAPGSPEAITEGALRSSVQELVAPAAYRTGLLDPATGEAWLRRAASDYAQWYASPVLDQILTGIHNVVVAHEAQPGPIASSVEVTAIDVPSASVSGDEASVEYATIRYVTHYAPGTWTQEAVSGVTMCNFTLHRASSGWRVVDESCNVSGG